MKEEITEVEQEDIITNNKNLLFYFSGHNNDLLVPKTMESCILKTKQTKTKKNKAKQNRTKTKTKSE